MPINFNPSTPDLSGTLQLRGNWRYKMYPEAASGDFDAGEVVILSGDSVTQMDTAPAAEAYSSALGDTVYPWGIAMEDASGTTGAYVCVAVPLDTSAEFLVRVGTTTSGSDNELQDVALGDQCPIHRYATSAATGTKIRTTVGATAGSGTNKVLVSQKYSYLYNAGNSADQAAGDDYGLVWVKPIQNEWLSLRGVSA